MFQMTMILNGMMKVEDGCNSQQCIAYRYCNTRQNRPFHFFSTCSKLLKFIKVQNYKIKKTDCITTITLSGKPASTLVPVLVLT